jgi:hypothetical protein
LICTPMNSPGADCTVKSTGSLDIFIQLPSWIEPDGQYQMRLTLNNAQGDTVLDQTAPVLVGLAPCDGGCFAGHVDFKL